MKLQDCRMRGLQRVFMVGVLTVGLGVSAHAEVIDRILAIVGGDLIMLSDVNAARNLGLMTPESTGDPIREVLSRLIDRRLQLAEVDRYAPQEPTPEEIDREVQSIRPRFPSQAEFDWAVARSGLNT